MKKLLFLGISFWMTIFANAQAPGIKIKNYEVYENRALKSGRKISLRIAILPATTSEKLPDPIFFFSGGPGVSAVADVSGLVSEFATLLKHRDFVLIDQRGTGKSNSLAFPMYGSPENPQNFLADFFPPEAVRNGRKLLEAKADLTQYTTSIAVEDTDEIRNALGYDRINLIGISYGTRMAMEFLRRHPDHVRAALLRGVTPVDDRMPLHIPARSQRALGGILSDCLNDPECKKAYPNIQSETKIFFENLATPVKTEILHPKTGAMVSVTLSKDLAAEAVRYLMYDSSMATQVPMLLHEGSRGNYQPVAEMAFFFRLFIVNSGANGLYLSTICTEDVSQIKPGEGEAAAKGSFVGEYRLQQQKQACSLWPKGNIPADFLEPVKTDVPVLLLSGQWDPATPPSDAERVAKNFSNSLPLVVPQGGHNFEGLIHFECIQDIVNQFIMSGSVKNLDTACLAKVHRIPFDVSAPDLQTITLKDEQLQELAGVYSGEFEATIKVKGYLLEIDFPGEENYLLAPVSATRFRAVGLPGGYVIFQKEAQSTKVSLEMGGGDGFTLTKK